MIFKNKLDGRIADLSDIDLIEQFKNDEDWEEGSYKDLPKPIGIKEPTYDELVDSKIRQKYTLSQELAIHRHKEDNNSNPQEWEEFNTYCEQCKLEAKQEIASKENLTK